MCTCIQISGRWLPGALPLQEQYFEFKPNRRVWYMNSMYLNEELESHANRNRSRKITSMSVIREEWTGKSWKQSYLWINGERERKYRFSSRHFKKYLDIYIFYIHLHIYLWWESQSHTVSWWWLGFHFAYIYLANLLRKSLVFRNSRTHP